ncbi:unnamed protein product [Arctogadus glacialis]
MGAGGLGGGLPVCLSGRVVGANPLMDEWPTETYQGPADLGTHPGGGASTCAKPTNYTALLKAVREDYNQRGVWPHAALQPLLAWPQGHCQLAQLPEHHGGNLAILMDTPEDEMD